MPEPPKPEPVKPAPPTSSSTPKPNTGSMPKPSTSSPGNGGSGGNITYLGNGNSSGSLIIQTKSAKYSYNKRYDLGKGWHARFDRGVVGNKDHVTVYNDSEEYYMAVDGAKSHKNKSKPGDPPNNVLKELKKQTGFDWKETRGNYIKRVFDGIDDRGAIILPDDTVFFSGEVYWKNDYETSVKPYYVPFRTPYMPELPRSLYIYEEMIDPSVYVVPIPGVPMPITDPIIMPFPVFG